MSDRFQGCRVHESALIEDDVSLGPGTSVWDGVHIRHGATLGRDCIVGEKTYIAYDVRIGDYCKLNASVYVCAGVTIEEYTMISAHTVFTNDLHPRAFDIKLDGLATSDVTEDTLETHVGRGVTIGANATIGPGISLGDFSMVGMGSVLTKSIPAHAVAVGNPARVIGWVCTCGPRFADAESVAKADTDSRFSCKRCGRVFGVEDGQPRELEGPTHSANADSEA